MATLGGVFNLPLVPVFAPSQAEWSDARNIVRNYFDRHQNSGAVVVKLSGVYLELIHPNAVPDTQKIHMVEVSRKLNRQGNFDVTRQIVGEPLSIPDALEVIRQSERDLNLDDVQIEMQHWSTDGTVKYATAIHNVQFIKPGEKSPLHQVTRRFEEILGEPYQGMTTPEFYLGCGGSSVNWHIDDGCLGTFHIHLQGSQKRFYVVDPAQTSEMIAYLKRNTPGKCARRWAHYGVDISPEKLVQNGFRVFTALLNPSDVIMLQPGCFHAVLNMNGMSLAGAVGLPTPNWLDWFHAIEPYGCRCGISKVPIKFFPHVTVRGAFSTWNDCLNGGATVKHICPYLDCNFFTALLTNVVQHETQVHTDRNEWQFQCDICPKKFSRQYHLDRHKVQMHQE